MSIKIPTRIEPQNSLGSTHVDTFGVGGFVVVSTGALVVASSAEVNAVVIQPRRKVGMRVHDTSTQQDYVCTATGTLGASPDDGAWAVLTIAGGTY